MRQAIRETLEIGRRANCPVHISHFNSLDNSWWINLDEADRGADMGVSVSFDTYAWAAGSTLLHFSFPDWALDGGVQTMLARLEDPETRARIEAGMRDQIGVRNSDWSSIRLASVPSPANNGLEGRFVSDIAKERGVAPESFVVDLVRAERGVVAAVAHNSATDADFEMIMRHPAHICSTDALLTGGSPHPRTYGTYPRFLGQFVRDRGALSLEEMIRHMTSAPARRFGLIDRGLIHPGMAADLVLIDMPRVRSNATFDNPTQYPDGIDLVIVNGEIVVDHVATPAPRRAAGCDAASRRRERCWLRLAGAAAGLYRRRSHLRPVLAAVAALALAALSGVYRFGYRSRRAAGAPQRPPAALPSLLRVWGALPFPS